MDINRNIQLNKLFFLFRAELKNPQYKVRFGLLLEAYLRYCGDYAEDLGRQVRTVDKLTFIAEIIQNSTHDELYNQVRSFSNSNSSVKIDVFYF